MGLVRRSIGVRVRPATPDPACWRRKQEGMQQLTRSLDAWARPHLKAWARLWRCRCLASVTCTVNRRLLASLGRCRPAAGVIELNPRLLSSAWRLRGEVLCHEAAHLTVRELHGSAANPHGQEWRELMVLAGFKPRVVIPGARQARRSPGSESANRMRAVGGLVYEHRCPVCQFTRLARRPVRRWRCAACVGAGLDGVLLITRMPAGVRTR